MQEAHIHFPLAVKAVLIILAVAAIAFGLSNEKTPDSSGH